MNHVVSQVSEIKVGNISLHSFGYQCTCGFSTIDLTQVADHVVENQYVVRHDPRIAKLGFPKDVNESYE